MLLAYGTVTIGIQYTTPPLPGPVPGLEDTPPRRGWEGSGRDVATMQ
jgi:hypothetical protein